MALVVKLAQYGNGSVNGADKVTLKAEVESPLSIRRAPIIIPLPGGNIVGIDLGKNFASISMSGVVDTNITELYVKNNIGTFTVGETVRGTAAWDSLTSPARGAAPTAVVVAGNPSLSAPTSLIVSGLSSLTEFFVDGESLMGLSSGATAVVDQPLPSKRRLEHIARFWYSSGPMTLTTVSGTYTVLISGIELSLEAGYEDRYKFRIDFAESSQSLSSPLS
jgi:hypothetical protein